MPSATTLIAVVLAGGRSSRMGTDKAGLRHQGLTLLERQLSLARALAGERHAWVSGSYEGLPCLPDTAAGQGPLSGVQASLKRFQWELPGAWAVFVPVDMPGLTLDSLRPLADANALGTDAAAYAGSELPFAVRVSQDTLTRVEELLRDGRRSVRRLLMELNAELLPPSPLSERNLLNLNTPVDWKGWTQDELSTGSQ